MTTDTSTITGINILLLTFTLPQERFEDLDCKERSTRFNFILVPISLVIISHAIRKKVLTPHPPS